MANSRCINSKFFDEIEKFAYGVDWDTQELTRLAALSALPRVGLNLKKAKNILKFAIKSTNEVVRDVAIEVAQEFSGIPVGEIQMGNGDGNLKDLVDPNIIKWILSE